MFPSSTTLLFTLTKGRSVLGIVSAYIQQHSLSRLLPGSIRGQIKFPKLPMQSQYGCDNPGLMFKGIENIEGARSCHLISRPRAGYSLLNLIP